MPAGDSPSSSRDVPVATRASELRGVDGANRERPSKSLHRSEGPLATPVARRLADEAQLDLTGVRGTGSAGRITKSDVLHHSEPAASAAAAPPAPLREDRPTVSSRPAPAPRQSPAYMSYELQPGDNVVQMTPQRRLIAEHMVYSKHTSPHVGTVAELDVSDIVRMRARNKRSFQHAHGFSLTFLPFIVHATVRALREFPALNASVMENAIVEKKSINIGLAVETPKGLVAPVLQNADRLSLAGIATAIEDLSRRARSKKLGADELKGGTFTLSNPGRRGNLYGFAIINQPQVGILRIGEIVKRPVVRTIEGEDTIAIRSMMHLALSYDFEEANVSATETIVAVSNDDEVNVLSSLLAKRYGAKRAVTLINNSSYGPLVSTLGIDVVVSPRDVTVSTILQHVRRGRIRAVHSIREGLAEVIEAEALETSPLMGTPLREVNLPAGIIIGAVVRGDEVIIPHGDTVIQTKDRVIILAAAGQVKKVEKLFSVRLEFF